MPAFLAKNSCPVAQPGLSTDSALPCQRVRSGARRGVEHAAGRVAHVGFVGLGLDPHFLDRFDRRHDGRAIDEVGDRHAFEQVAVAAARAAAEREVRGVGLVLVADELRVAGLDHARRGNRRRRRRCGRRSAASAAICLVERRGDASRCSARPAAHPPVTVICSRQLPTSSVKSCTSVCCVPTRRPRRSSVLKPASATLSAYAPGSTPVNTYSPDLVGDTPARGAGLFVREVRLRRRGSPRARRCTMPRMPP